MEIRDYTKKLTRYWVDDEIPKAIEVEENGEKIKLYPFVLSTEAMDRQFEIVRLNNASIANFKNNPQMYLNHDTWRLPIGQWRNIRIEDKKLLADAYFHLDTPESIDAEKLVSKGMLRAASIGFKSLKRSEEEPEEKELAQIIRDNTWRGKIVIHEKIEILEASIVGLPANHEALMGKDYNLQDDVINSLKSLEPGSPYEPDTTKAGAVLSKANKSKLEEALNKIQSVLDSATIEEPEKELTEEVEELKIEVQNLKELVNQQNEIIAGLRKAAEPEVIDLETYLKKKI